MLMIYGANGYTGALIARRAKARRVEAVLAGRNHAALAAAGAEVGLPVRRLTLGGASSPIDAALRVPAAWRTRSIDFGDGPEKAVSIPWGDVASAYHTTGIGNVEVYVAVPLAVRMAARATRYMGPLLATRPVRRFLTARVRRGPPGPTAEQRAHGESRPWAQVRDAACGVAFA